MSTPSFVGRDWVSTQVDEWLAGTEAALLITGKPGSGKTTLVEHLQTVRPGAFTLVHACRAGDSATLDPLQFVECLAAAVAARVPEYALTGGGAGATIAGTVHARTVEADATVAGVMINRLVVGELPAVLAYERMVRAPLAACADRLDADIIVVVDGGRSSSASSC